MKFGIYLGYAPEQSIRNQGIGRLMVFIIKGAISAGKEPFTIACPQWYIKNLQNLLDDFKIKPNQVKIITTQNIPFAIRIRNNFSKLERNFFFSRKTSKYFKILPKLLKRKLFQQLIKLMAASAWYDILLKMLLMLPLISLIIIFGPFIFLKNIGVKFFKIITQKLTIFSFLKKWSKAPINILKSDVLARASYEEIRRCEFIRLNKVVNAQKDISAWYIPSLFWPEIAGINAKKIVAAPDAVYLDFPTLFANWYFAEVDKQIKKTTAAADSLICYSHYVKSKHFVKGFNLKPKDIKVISHGWIDLSEYLRANNKICREKAKFIVNKWIKNTYPKSCWFRNFDLGTIDYFFYASQQRPHKNFIHLFKSFQYLLRRKYINAKLIITAAISDPELINYIHENRLQFEIIQLYDVPAEVLAALNALAVCAINPSYFEGGFPFTFSEAYSVGTPSIMSNISVVQEIIDDKKLAELMLFDPTNCKDIVEKMAWAYQNRQKLLEKQAPLAEKLSNRSWSKVAEEYIEVMESLS